MSSRDWKVLALVLALCACKAASNMPNVITPGGTGGTTTNLASNGGQAAPGATNASGVAATGGSLDPNSFNAIYHDIIVGVGCNGGSLCHGGVVGNLTMTSRDQAYAALVGVKAMGMNLTNTMNKGTDCRDSGLTRVVPGMPEMSLLMLKVERLQPCGDPMPAAPLAPEKVVQIRAWIANGAKDD